MRRFVQRAMIMPTTGGGNSGGGGDTGSQLDALIERSITEVSSNATEVGHYAFYNCIQITTAYFPVATSIGTYAFNNCKSLTTVNFPNATSISSSAFEGCNGLTTTNFPNATSIGSYAFRNCNFTTVNFPNATSINTNAFNSCRSLTTADLPVATSIANYAFNYCSSLATLILRNSTVVSLSNTNSFDNTPIKNGTGYIYVPKALVDTYKSATNWSTYASQFRAIEDYSVDGTIYGEVDPNKPQKTKYTIRFLDGDTVLQESQVAEGEMPVYTGAEPTKEEYVFNGWTPEIVVVTGDTDYQVKWKSIVPQARALVQGTIQTVERNDKIVNDYAFYKCSNLTTVNFPVATSIGNNAFGECSVLETVSFPNATIIGTAAFIYCDKLTVIDLPVVETISANVFYGSDVFTTLILRSEKMCALVNKSALNNTPIANGTGYIYVPRALIDSYKAATNWSIYATQFRAIEDYPEICGEV